MTAGRRTALVALASGAAASLAMNVVQTSFTSLFERGRASDDRDEEVEAIASVVRLIGTLAPSLSREGRSDVTARILHYGFGIAFAYAYVTAAARAPSIASGKGVAFGSTLFLISDRALIPLLRLGRNWSHYSRGERFNAFASHLAYGFVLESVRARLTRDDDADIIPR